MGETQNELDKMWVCHPDEEESHITKYSESVGGCQIHQIAGGCTLPIKSLQALINTEVLKALNSIEVPKKIDMKHAIRTHSDAGAGTVIGNNHCVDKIQEAIKQVKEKYTV